MSRLLLTILALMLLKTPAHATDFLDIQAILPLTGGNAFTGVGARDNLDALADATNQAGGIAGRQVRFVYHDDESNPQNDVQIASSLIASNPPIIMGSALVSLCNAMAPLMRQGPVLYCLSPAFNPPAGSYGFAGGTATIEEIAALLRYFRRNGWTRIAILNTTDATAQNADHAILQAMAVPENKSLQVVSNQHFNAQDVTVEAQMQLVRTSGAQALIAWTTGPAVATIFKAMIHAGLDLPIATSAGNETPEQMHQYAAFLPRRLLIGSALFPAHDSTIQLDPRVEAAQHRMYAVMKAHHRLPDTGTATAWDPGLIVLDAFRALGPTATATQIRQHILSLTDFAGVDGIYDFTTNPASGLRTGSAAVVTWNPTTETWIWLSEPGGAPLAPPQ